MYTVKVFTRGLAYIEHIDKATDLESACALILRHGLMTVNKNGRIWFPPTQIHAVCDIGADD